MLDADISGDFELYVVDHGLVKVSSGMQRRILLALRDGNMSPTEISHIVGRSRSTLSAHLSKMVSEGLISYRDNDSDMRGRVYYLRADPLIKAKMPDRDAYYLSAKIFDEAMESPKNVSNLILRSMVLTLDGVGLDVGPMMFSIGCDMAESFLPNIRSRDITTTLDIAKRYFDEFDIGELCVYSKDPITILFRDTVDLTQTSAEVMASFVSGFLITLFRANFSKNYIITDQEVFGDMNNYIRMKFEPDDCAGT